jgi:hypothetical protein
MTAIEHFGGKCQLCGYNKCPSALEFHHLDQSQKLQAPSYIIMRWTWEKAIVELEKCILVCSNCHKEIHYGFHNAQDLMTIVRPTKTKKCVQCDKEFKTKRETQLYCCASCSFLAQRKTKRPDKECLRAEIETMSWVGIGRKYGVSDNAVRKWAKQFGLLA